MKKIEAIIRSEKTEIIKDKLFEHGITGITITQVLGCGRQKGYKNNIYRGVVVDVNVLPKTKLEIVIDDDEKKVDEIIAVIMENARTDKIGDGKIFVSTVDRVIRIRTGETGKDAI